MNYEFPKIDTIEDVLPAIEGRDEFIIAERDGYKVINYTVAFEDTFPPVHTAGGTAKMRAEQTRLKALRRECRGLIFDEHGKLIARRFQKFFNVNERDETRLDKIDWSKPHRILEKLDGSMISPIPVRGVVRWTTKMGITDTAMQVETFVATRPHYVQFALASIALGVTPIFEWLSRQQRIVVDYPTENLVLTAVRDNYTGEYYRYDSLVQIGSNWNIPVVVAHEITSDLIETISQWEGSEGVVVRFDSGHMVKIKAEWYVLRHKSKDAITREKNVIEYIVNDRVDDVLPFLEQHDQKQLVEFRDLFWANINESVRNVIEYVHQMQSKGIDKKAWAVSVRPSANFNSDMVGFVFAMYDGKDLLETMLIHIRKNINTQTKVNSVRHLWGNLTWNYNYDHDL